MTLIVFYESVNNKEISNFHLDTIYIFSIIIEVKYLLLYLRTLCIHSTGSSLPNNPVFVQLLSTETGIRVKDDKAVKRDQTTLTE